jgi:hypothetical protein
MKTKRAKAVVRQESKFLAYQGDPAALLLLYPYDTISELWAFTFVREFGEK